MKMRIISLLILFGLSSSYALDIELQKGWNLIGNPFTTSISSSQFQDAEAVFSWDSEKRSWITNPTNIESCSGFWVYVDETKQATISAQDNSCPTCGESYCTPSLSDSSSLWFLLGTGVELSHLNSTFAYDKVYVYRDVEWSENPDTISIGEGFWVKISIPMNSSSSSSLSSTQTYTPWNLASLATGQMMSNTDYDDGYYKQGSERSFSRDNSKKIVIDNLTGLQWQDDADAANVYKSWITETNYELGNYDDTSGDTAATYCENLTLGGYNDWRLPTINELKSIVDFGRYMPTINPTFQNISLDFDGYWSATDEIDHKENAWAIMFNFGDDNDGASRKSLRSKVRCVRGDNRYMLSFTRDDKVDIVTDTVNNLQWQDDMGAKNITKTWGEAIKYCESLTLGGYTNWRLPNINEFASLSSYERASPNLALNSIFQNSASTLYWSSSVNIEHSALAWFIGFSNEDVQEGYGGGMSVNVKTDAASVRCVRTKQSGESEPLISSSSSSSSSFSSATFSKPTQSECTSNGGTWYSSYDECYVTWDNAMNICTMPSKEDWLAVFASCGADTTNG